MKHRISAEAHNDLQNIWLYTNENWSAEQANRYFNLIMDEIEFICESPHSGKNYEAIRKGYFKARVKSHFIFYKINQVREEIEIIRVLHQRMDIDTRLND